MADISQIKIGNDYYQIKDEVAREALNLLNRPINYIGISAGIGPDTSHLTPILDRTHIEPSVNDRLLPTYENSLIKDNSENKLLTTGDVVTYRSRMQAEDENPREYIFILDGSIDGQGTFFELASNLGALAYVDTGHASLTPAGTNSSSDVTLAAGEYVTQFPVGEIQRKNLVIDNMPKINNGIVNESTETLDLSNIFGSSVNVTYATGYIDSHGTGHPIVSNILNNNGNDLVNLVALSNPSSTTVDIATSVPTSGTAAALTFTGNPATIIVRPI